MNLDLRAIRARIAAQPRGLKFELGDRLYLVAGDDSRHLATMADDDAEHIGLADAWKHSRDDLSALVDELTRTPTWRPFPDPAAVAYSAEGAPWMRRTTATGGDLRILYLRRHVREVFVREPDRMLWRRPDVYDHAAVWRPLDVYGDRLR